MKKEFTLAFNEILDDKQLPREVVLEALEAAMVSAYRKTVNASNAQEIDADFDLETGKVTIYAEKEVVEDVQDERTEVELEKARQHDPEAELGSVVLVESTPADFGRVAAQTARQVIQQRIREAEREAQYEHFKKLEGEIVNGIVQAANPRVITLGLDRKAEGIMPRREQIPGERFHVHDRVRALLLEVKETPRGPQITLSRAHRKFLRRLLEDEVPEIYNGMVEIRAIAREPGYRSKVAVSALQPGIDPVGACVGIRGVRIQAIVRELNDEKIDVIEWNPDPAAFIAKSLSPARVKGVYLEEDITGAKTATVVVPEDQLSLAIGRDGQNARLAAKLTGWRIDIKSLSEAAADALHALQSDPEYAEDQESLEEAIPDIEGTLTKKEEGRPITPEEYQNLAEFVEQVEHGATLRQEAVIEAEREAMAEARAKIPASAFDIPLDDLGLTPSMTIKITGEGYSSIGDLMLQLELDPDVIRDISGVGPKTMESIDELIDEFDFPVVEVEEEQVEEEEEVEAEVEVEEAPEAELAEEALAEAEAEEVAAEAPPAEVEEEEEEEPEEEPEEEAPVEEEEEEEEDREETIDEIFARTSERILGKSRASEVDWGARGKKKRKQQGAEQEPDLEKLEPQPKRKRKGKRQRGEEWDEDEDYWVE